MICAIVLFCYSLCNSIINIMTSETYPCQCVYLYIYPCLQTGRYDYVYVHVIMYGCIIILFPWGIFPMWQYVCNEKHVCMYAGMSICICMYICIYNKTFIMHELLQIQKILLSFKIFPSKTLYFVFFKDFSGLLHQCWCQTPLLY